MSDPDSDSSVFMTPLTFTSFFLPAVAIINAHPDNVTDNNWTNTPAPSLPSDKNEHYFNAKSRSCPDGRIRQRQVRRANAVAHQLQAAFLDGDFLLRAPISKKCPKAIR
jgi:hypothetical protein